jgi:hypothetical protein
MIGLGLSIVQLAVRQLLGGAFTPATLFGTSDQGVWYDPSDFSSLAQDSAGTTPVTALEQPVGRMLDKSGKGNHATQPTATSRPVVSARVNLLTKTAQFDDSVWTKNQVTAASTTATTDPLGGTTANVLTATASTNIHRIFQSLSVVAANIGISEGVSLKKATHRYATVISASDLNSGWIAATIDLDSGAITKTGVGGSSPAPSLTSAISVAKGDGWYSVSLVGVPTQNSARRNFIVALASSATPTYGATFADDSWTASGTESVYIWGADLRVANDGVGLPAYQRVNTATDYDSTGFPVYLRADGVDDGMVTNSIDFTATDKMTVVAGVRKLSDAAVGMFAELSVSSTSNPGSFWLAAPVTTGTSGSYGWRVQGTGGASATGVADLLAPISNVVTGTGSIVTPLVGIRVDGVPRQISSTSLGTGNFGNYPLYLFRRGGSSLPFNGRFYGMTIVNKLLSTAELEQLETYTNGKTRAFA